MLRSGYWLVATKTVLFAYSAVASKTGHLRTQASRASSSFIGSIPSLKLDQRTERVHRAQVEAMSSSSEKPVAVVFGVGPGIGGCVAEKFASEGYNVALVSRKLSSLEPTKVAIESDGGSCLMVTADCTSEESIRSAMKTIREQTGTSPEALIYNTGPSIGNWPPPGILDVKVEDFKVALNVGVTGALVASQEALPTMVAAGKGTIIFTGATAALRGGKGFVKLASPKFALRALAQSLCREFAPQGIHCSHVIIDGMVDLGAARSMRASDNKESFLNPREVAEQYWMLHSQHPSVWTHELDLRPHVEKW